MSDARVSALERRYHETRSQADERAWLVALLRQGGALRWERYRRLCALDPEAAGEFLRERARGLFSEGALRAAAACGDPGCRYLADFLPIPPGWFDHPQGARQRDRLAEHFSQVPLVSEALALRVALVCVEAALPAWEEAQDDPTPRQLFHEARAWVELRQPSALALTRELAWGLKEFQLDEAEITGQPREVARLARSLVEALSAADSSLISRSADLRDALRVLGHTLPEALEAPASVVIELLLEVVVRPLLTEALDEEE